MTTQEVSRASSPFSKDHPSERTFTCGCCCHTKMPSPPSTDVQQRRKQPDFNQNNQRENGKRNACKSAQKRRKKQQPLPPASSVTSYHKAKPAPTVKMVFTSFCRWTTLRGFPHFVRSEHLHLTILWALFVAITFAFNVGLVILLLTRYYNYNTIENIKTERNVSVLFPAVTVCNVDPVNTDRIFCLKKFLQNPHALKDHCKHLGNSDPHQILKAFNQTNEYMKYNQTLVSQLEDASKISIFYQLIGMEAASVIGHQKEDFVISDFCYVTHLDQDGNLIRSKCENASVKWDILIHYKHFNCYTLTITNATISRRTIRLSVSLYLDEEEDLSCRPYCTHEFTEWSGAKVVVHSPGTFPLIEKRAMNLYPGASSQVLIQEVRLLKSSTLGDRVCEHNSDRLVKVKYYALNNRQPRVLNYTQELCIILEYQREFMKTCNCIDPMFPIPYEDANVTSAMPVCGNLSHPQFITNLECKRTVRREFTSKQRNSNCTASCESMEYYVELTQLRWPNKPNILNLVKNLETRPFYERKFKVYEEVEEKLKTNSSIAMDQLRSLKVFENNFLQVDVNRPSVDIHVRYQENEEYTLATLLSQIGGICSIFLGVTFVTIMELLELSFRLVVAMWNTCRGRAHSTPPPTENLTSSPSPSPPLEASPGSHFNSDPLSHSHMPKMTNASRSLTEPFLSRPELDFQPANHSMITKLSHPHGYTAV